MFDVWGLFRGRPSTLHKRCAKEIARYWCSVLVPKHPAPWVLLFVPFVHLERVPSTSLTTFFFWPEHHQRSALSGRYPPAHTATRGWGTAQMVQVVWLALLNISSSVVLSSRRLIQTSSATSSRHGCCVSSATYQNALICLPGFQLTNTKAPRV